MAEILSTNQVEKMRARFDPRVPTDEERSLCEDDLCGGCFICWGPPIVGLFPPNATDLIASHEALRERLDALEAFSLREDSEGRALLTYEHADGEVCVVAYLTCPAVLEVAAVLWPTAEEEPGGA